MKIKGILWCYLFVALPLLMKAQDYPQDYFRSPVDSKLVLSGTFAELRPNHFHSGIDIKTNGKEGKPIYVIADGYLSRIKVAPGGFGKALYIEHPNGYTSVYAHLSKFHPSISKFVREKQYEEESFSVNLFPEEEEFSFKKGDLIAYSGNSGSSLGPHLHFEIRDTDTQEPINPLLFGLKVRDFIRPRIKLLKLYPHGDYSRIDGKPAPKAFEIAGWGPKYRLKSNDTIHVSGDVSFGIQTYDLLNRGLNPSGNFSIEVLIDSNLVYSHHAKRFSYSESRYINALLDYPEYVENRRRVQKTHILPNNKLSIYQKVSNKGVFNFTDDTIHEVLYLIRDINGNFSRLRFLVQGHKPKVNNIQKLHKKPELRSLFKYDEENKFENEWVTLRIPQYAMYDNIRFHYDSLGSSEHTLSPLHEIHKPIVPLHRYVELALRAPDTLPDSLYSKLLIARYENEKYIPEGGEYEAGYMRTRVREFGKYTLVLDTVSPSLRPLNLYNGKSISKQQTLQFEIKDELSGIDEYRGSLNGNWILMEFDPKNDLLIYFVDDRMKKGKNQLQLVVKDERGNERSYKAEINYR